MNNNARRFTDGFIAGGGVSLPAGLLVLEGCTIANNSVETDHSVNTYITLGGGVFCGLLTSGVAPTLEALSRNNGKNK